MLKLATRLRMPQSSTAAFRVAQISQHLSMSSSAPTASASASTDSVLYESHSSARIYKLNRPKARNALNKVMIDSLRDKIKSWSDSELCKVIIGTGDNVAFCAGGDVKSLVIDVIKEKKEIGIGKSGLEFFKDEFELNWALARLSKPYVAIMHGITMGGGAGLALPARLRVATEKTKFAMPETIIGYAPDVGTNFYLAQLDGGVGTWLALTGQTINGKEVYELGIATHYVAESTLPKLVEDLSQLEEPKLAQLASILASHSAHGSAELTTPIQGAVRTFLDKTFNPKAHNLEAILSQLEEAATGQDEVAKWAGAQLALMKQRSPTALKVALEGIKRAQEVRKLDEVLKNGGYCYGAALMEDINMATAFCSTATDDFTLGVSHLLIDKIKEPSHPAWKPASASDEAITDEAIRSTFFTKSSSAVLKHSPEVELPKAAGDKSLLSSTWGNFRQFGLPSESKIKDYILGEDPSSGAYKVTEEELIRRLQKRMDKTGDSSERKAELAAVVKDAVERRGEKDQDGYLGWKRG